MGNAVLSTGYFEIHGQGTNQAWGFKTQVNFDSKHRVMTCSVIKQNDGKTLVVEQEYPLVTQEVQTSTGTIELAWPKDQLLSTLTDVSLKVLLKSNPELLALQSALKFYEKFDPNYKRALTGLAKSLNYDFEPSEHRKFNHAVKAMMGAKIRYTYINGLGVQQIEDISDKPALTMSELKRLAARAGLLTDYFILEVDSLREGQSKTLAVEEIAQMVTLPADFDVQGDFTFRKTPQAELAAVPREKGQHLTLSSGKINVSAMIEGLLRRARMSVTRGDVFLSRDDKLVTEARVEWESDLNWASEDDLLFKTTGQANLKFRSYYEARKLKPGETVPAPQ